MGDSDDDQYDRRSRGRDKFRRERNDYEGRREERRRDPWEERSSSRDAWSSRSRERRDYGRDYEGHRRDRYGSPPRNVSPPMKRMRRDWDEGYGGGGGGYDMPYGGHMQHRPQGGHGWGPGPGDMPPPQQYGGHPGGPRGGEVLDYPTQPPMMTFKQFLSQQDDNINDSDAVKKYNEYKVDFARQQVNEFFLNHKDEEWFKTKYHPEECDRRQEETRVALKHRASVFVKLLEMGRLDNIAVEMERHKDLVKLLDSAIILMEGGSEFDLKVLDTPVVDKPEDGSRSRTNSESQPAEKSQEIKKGDEKSDGEPGKGQLSGDQEDSKKQGQEFSQKSNGDQGDRKEKKKKRHRDKTEYSYESGSESSSGSESESEPAPPGVDDDEPLPPGVEPGSAGEKTEKSPKKEPKTSTSKEPGEDDEDGEDKDAETKPRALHQTLSIFLRNLAPTITKQEVEAMCKRYPGFIRTALQDPQPERRWSRRGWVTFDKSVNIKDICWNLNNIRLRDCEMGAIVNRDIKQRIRPMNGITTHPKVAQQDIKNAAKIIQNFDTKWRIWEDGDDKKEEEKESFGLVSKNPVLKNITDYLVEEGSYEEEELLGEALEEKKDEKNGEEASERDDKMMQVLDRMLLYLRIVYSVDYYSGAEYPQEDDMPHRVGIMHSRLITHPKLTLQDVTDWMNNFRIRIKQFLDMKDKIDDEEATKLGRKDPDAEVEKFIVANTQELAKDKWLCPLSGKKFKGPDFVRKHIFNKHGEKIDEVKIEVAFFNNYLMDPKRVQLPEHPANKQGGGMPSGVNRGGDFNMPPGGYQGPPQQGMMGYNQPRPQMMGGNYQGGHPQFNSPPYHQGREEPFRRDNYNRPRGLQSRSSRSRQDPRGIIEYRDLDAPDDMDIF